MAVTESRLALEAKESNNRADDLYEQNVRLQQERDNFEKDLAEANTKLRFQTEHRKKLEKTQSLEKREHEQTIKQLNEKCAELQRASTQIADNDKELKTLRRNLENAQKDLGKSKHEIDNLRKESKANEDAYKSRASTLEDVARERDKYHVIAEEEETKRLELMDQIERLFGKNGFDKKPSELLEAAYKDLDEYKQKLKTRPSHDSLPALNYDHSMRGRHASLGDELGADFGSDISDSEFDLDEGDEPTLKADGFLLAGEEDVANGDDDGKDPPKHQLPLAPVPNIWVSNTKRTRRLDNSVKGKVQEEQSSSELGRNPHDGEEFEPKIEAFTKNMLEATSELGLDDTHDDEVEEVFKPKIEVSPKPKLSLDPKNKRASFAELPVAQPHSSHRQELSFANASPPTVLELLRALPTSAKIIMLFVVSMSIALFIMEWCAVYGERKLWLAANGATRIHVLSITHGGGGFSWADMFNFGVENILGVRRGYLD